MFDTVVNKIIQLIRGQLYTDNSCSAIFLVGGFSESKYLQRRIKKAFQHRIKHISVPQQPIAVIVRGAVKYGINKKYIKSRVLKYTYGRLALRPYKTSDPIDRIKPSGYVRHFSLLAKKGSIVKVDQKISQTLSPGSR